MGKSTLLKTLVGLIPPLSGSFTVGENVDAGYFVQQKAVINDEDPTQTVLENFQDTYPKLTNLEARSALAAFSFSQEEVETKLGQLSGGERVRLALCKMFYTRPNFLILDEPTNHMDIPGKEALEKMLQSYTGTVLFVSHDRYFIREVATGILDFANGEVTQYPFGYDEYLREKEKRSTTEEVSKTPAAADTAASVSSAEIKNPGKFRARIERKIEKIQGQIAESEEKTRILQEQLADPALASDFEKLMEIQAEIDQNEKQQEDLLNLLVETEEELTTL